MADHCRTSLACLIYNKYISCVYLQSQSSFDATSNSHGISKTSLSPLHEPCASATSSAWSRSDSKGALVLSLLRGESCELCLTAFAWSPGECVACEVECPAVRSVCMCAHVWSVKSGGQISEGQPAT